MFEAGSTKDDNIINDSARLSVTKKNQQSNRRSWENGLESAMSTW